MRVLFIAVNKEKSLRPALPIGMVTVATAAEAAGHDVKCIDLCFEEDDYEALSQGTEGFEAEIIGISVRNIDSLSYLEPVFYPPILLKVVRICRELFPVCSIFLGGPGFTLIPEELLRYTKADYGIAGLGECSVPMFLERMQHHKKVDDVPGILYFDGQDQLYAKAPDYSIDFSECLFPDHKFYDERYFTFEYNTTTESYKTVETIQTKKGCELRCIYCNNPKIDGPNVILRDPVKIVDEIIKIQEQGKLKAFEIVDGLFNLPYKHALTICKLMKEKKVNMPWGCMLNPGRVTDELVQLMAETGCRKIEFGSDSGSDSILRKLRKNYKKADIIRSHHLVLQYGIEPMHCVFLGSPGETVETLTETLDLMEELAPSSAEKPIQVYFNFGYRIFDSTRLYEIAIQEGVITKYDNLAVPRYYFEPSLLRDEAVLDMIQERVTKHSNWYLWWGLNQIKLSDRVKDAAEQFAKIGQLFQLVLDE
ncbi:B12-binding domain-containing radical SAM protein [Paenibacillus sp. NPDC057934]|uniref:B12-binding domain-containing radical SAM protein n=1 Tax=Paenibacillus sp. NPDC057934 TaxID=3346282 RepID=UPI0036DEC7B9